MNELGNEVADLQKQKIKDWYTKNYSTHDSGEELNDGVTFIDLWNDIPNVYGVIGVANSIIRERLFEHLAEIYGVSYNIVYNKWLERDDYADGGGDDNYADGGGTTIDGGVDKMKFTEAYMYATDRGVNADLDYDSFKQDFKKKLPKSATYSDKVIKAVYYILQQNKDTQFKEGGNTPSNWCYEIGGL